MQEDPFLKNGLPNNLSTEENNKYKRQNSTTSTKQKNNITNDIRRVTVKQYNVNIQCRSDSLMGRGKERAF